jgi:hypothetical protein
MRFCPNCGAPFASGQGSTCQHCGISLIERITQSEANEQAGTIASSPNLQKDNSPDYNTILADPWQDPVSNSYAGSPSGPGYTSSQQPANNPIVRPDYTMPANQGNSYGQISPGPTHEAISPIPAWSNLSRNKKKFHLRGFTVFLVLFTLLIMGSGFWLIYYATVSHPATLHAQATATMQAISTANTHATTIVQTHVTGTAIAQANATATVVTQATAQAQATVTALQDLYTKSTSGTPDLNSPLNAQDGENWDLYDAVGGGGCAFTNGALHASVMQKSYYVPCFALNSQYSNFALQAQMNIKQGDEGGLIFRGNETNSQFYLFRISQDGSYGLYVSKDNTHNTAIIDDSSSAIKKGVKQNNLITIIAKGSTIFIYINKQYVGSVSDSSYANGEIGVFASNNGHATDVAFNNVQVWKL